VTFHQTHHRYSLTVQVPRPTDSPLVWFVRRAVFFMGGALLALTGGIVVPAAATGLGLQVVPEVHASVPPAPQLMDSAPVVDRPSAAPLAVTSVETTRLLDPTFTVDVSELPKAPVERAPRSHAMRTSHPSRPTRVAHAPAHEAHETSAFDEALAPAP
jgi:hypothetical protein